MLVEYHYVDIIIAVCLLLVSLLFKGSLTCFEIIGTQKIILAGELWVSPFSNLTCNVNVIFMSNSAKSWIYYNLIERTCMHRLKLKAYWKVERPAGRYSLLWLTQLR